MGNIPHFRIYIIWLHALIINHSMNNKKVFFDMLSSFLTTIIKIWKVLVESSGWKIMKLHDAKSFSHNLFLRLHTRYTICCGFKIFMATSANKNNCDNKSHFYFCDIYDMWSYVECCHALNVSFCVCICHKQYTGMFLDNLKQIVLQV